MNRDDILRRLQAKPDDWVIIVIGGGATGVGVALDAAARGYDVALLEQSDFGKGTSTRSTKLIHGGVRYLQQGNVPLVMEALKERGILRGNAPHLVHDLPFVVPNYKWWEAPFYGIGMRVYDVLAGKYGFGHSQNLSREETLERIPNIEDDDLRGGVVYHDGQFDDARLLIALARTAHEQGAALLNYAPVTGLLKDDDGFVIGVSFRDAESGTELELRSRVVVNATGVFTDGIRRMDDPEARGRDHDDVLYGPRIGLKLLTALPIPRLAASYSRLKASTSCWTDPSWPATRPSWCRTRMTDGYSSPSLG